MKSGSDATAVPVSSFLSRIVRQASFSSHFPKGSRTSVAVILKVLCRIAIPAGVAACGINEKCTAAFTV